MAGMGLGVGLNIDQRGTGGVAPFLNDTFIDADGTALGSHVGQVGATWTGVAGGGSAAVYNSGGGVNDAYSTGGSFGVYKSSGVPAGTDQDVICVFRFDTAAGSSVGPTVHTNSTGSDFYALLYNISNSHFEVYRSAGGSITGPLASFTYAFAAGLVTTVVHVRGGATVTLTIDIGGTVAAISYTDNAPSALLKLAGVVGLWFNGVNTGTTGVHVAQITGLNA